jgi:hypothetical protein
MEPKLHDDKGHWNEEGQALTKTVENYLVPIISEYRSKGYSWAEIETTILHAAFFSCGQAEMGYQLSMWSDHD